MKKKDNRTVTSLDFTGFIANCRIDPVVSDDNDVCNYGDGSLLVRMMRKLMIMTSQVIMII